MTFQKCNFAIKSALLKNPLFSVLPMPGNTFRDTATSSPAIMQKQIPSSYAIQHSIPHRTPL
jgi:hypothetical protein